MKEKIKEIINDQNFKKLQYNAFLNIVGEQEGLKKALDELVEDGYYYVDKTMYIEKLEKLEDKRIMFLRPRKFGKTLFTSTLECYYDVSKKEEFKTLFANTYIGENPTKSKKCTATAWHMCLQKQLRNCTQM